jgi:murein DD-endopeptidase MepM/ murein hydrolase activator NlpD
MKKFFLFVCMMSANLSPLLSQPNDPEPANYRLFIDRFTTDFNKANWDAIVSNSSGQFLKSIPAKKLTDFLAGIKEAFGKIASTRFKYFDEKRSAVYYTTLEKTSFNFFVSLDTQNKITRLVVLDPNYNEDLPLRRNKTKMQLPFDGEWFTFWGGDKENENYHVSNRAQKNAFDLLILNAANRSFKTTGKTNEDFYAFGQKLYSPCDGEVVSVIDGVKDNVPGVMNPDQLTGNTIVLRSKKDEYILMAHFKLNSITVKKGQQVKAGHFIGLCGNSGNSSEAHLHLHIMDKPDLTQGTGIKCFFDKLKVNGTKRSGYSPVKGDRIARE